MVWVFRLQGIQHFKGCLAFGIQNLAVLGFWVLRLQASGVLDVFVCLKLQLFVFGV